MSEENKSKARDRRRATSDLPSAPESSVPFRERAAFRGALCSVPRADEIVWETQAYHEESKRPLTRI